MSLTSPWNAYFFGQFSSCQFSRYSSSRQCQCMESRPRLCELQRWLGYSCSPLVSDRCGSPFASNLANYQPYRQPNRDRYQNPMKMLAKEFHREVHELRAESERQKCKQKKSHESTGKNCQQ